MLKTCLYVAATERMAGAVFTKKDIPADTCIEISPVIVMSQADRLLLDKTLLHDYIFEWGEKKTNAVWHLAWYLCITTATRATVSIYEF
jgi:hypothetical protein